MVISPSHEMFSETSKPLVLAVDDDRIQLMMLVSMVVELGYEALQAKNGAEALEIIKDRKKGIHAILLDREMPEMNGMQVVERLKENRELSRIPIIMQTGSDSPEQIKEGIDAGVFYYLTKPIERSVLRSVLVAAVRESVQQLTLSSELEHHKTSFGLIEDCHFNFRTLSQAEKLSRFLGNCFPDPDRTVSGLAELLINAVEHGTLGITYDEKTELIDKKEWRKEVLRREDLPENKDKSIDVHFRKRPDEFSITIKDHGPGFEWQKYIQIDPSRASDNHGRGIALANTVSFDQVTFNDKGNEVTAHVGLEKELDW